MATVASSNTQQPAASNQADNRPYLLPYNQSESERLDLQHKFLTATFGSLYKAPIDTSKIKNVLDMGCGTGIWMVDFAKQHPEIQCHGVDIAEYPSWVDAPPNCTFSTLDLENEAQWKAFDRKFDYIHSRFLVSVVRNWRPLLERCYEHLTPGGYMELQEFYFPFQLQSTGLDKGKARILDFGRYMQAGLEKAGASPSAPIMFPFVLQDAGFSDPQEKNFRWLIGDWHEDPKQKEIGRMGLQVINMGIKGFTTTIFNDFLKLDPKFIDEMEQAIRFELADGSYKPWMPLKITWAQKPQA